MNSKLHVCDEMDDSKWRLLPDRDSNSTGESRFECIICGEQQFRGGWGSSAWLNNKKPLLHSELQAMSDRRQSKANQEPIQKNLTLLQRIKSIFK